MTIKKINLGQITDGDSLDVDVPQLIDSRMLIQGNSRSGKSYLLRVLCERVAGKVQTIIIDIEGEYASLREVMDAVLVGPGGDIPTDLRSAELLARKLLELRVSAIINIYDLKIHERREFVRRFLDSLMNLPKELWGPLLVPIDEAHKLCPEKGQGESVATQPIIDLMSQGGKRQYCGILITQRFSKLHNDAIAEANNVFIGRTWMDTDQVRAGKYLGMSPAERQALREIPQGEFYAFGPALSESGVVRFKADQAQTKVPKVGEKHNIKPPKASTAIQHIIEQIGDLPEAAEAEARDVAGVREQAKKRESDLQGQIVELKRQLAQADKPVEVPKEILVFPDEKLQELEEKIDEYFKPFAVAVDALQTTQATAVEIERMVLGLKERISVPEAKYVPAKPASEMKISSAPAPHRPTLPPVRSEPRPEGATELGQLHRTILNGTQLLHNIGIAEPSKLQVGAVIGKSHTAGPVRGAFNKLSEWGLAEQSDSNIRLTDAGRAEAVALNITSHAEIHELWYSRLKTLESNVLRALLAAYPNAVSRERIGKEIGKSHTAGPVRGAFNSLMDKGLAIEDESGDLVASSILFPEGLR